MSQAKGAKFRETLWFKLGEADASAEPDGTQPRAPVLPIEDRYLDDGSLSNYDSEQFGVHSGRTEALRIVQIDASMTSGAETEDAKVMNAIVREMRPLRTALLAALGASAIAAGVVAILML